MVEVMAFGSALHPPQSEAEDMLRKRAIDSTHHVSRSHRFVFYSIQWQFPKQAIASLQYSYWTQFFLNRRSPSPTPSYNPKGKRSWRID